MCHHSHGEMFPVCLVLVFVCFQMLQADIDVLCQQTRMFSCVHAADFISEMVENKDGHGNTVNQKSKHHQFYSPSSF